jgi:hypothetical protein
MFEVGKKYEIRMIIGGQETTLWRTVESYDHPMVKFADAHFKKRNDFLPEKTLRGEIVNITSPNFISATLQDSGVTGKESADD